MKTFSLLKKTGLDLKKKKKTKIFLCWYGRKEYKPLKCTFVTIYLSLYV